MTKTIFAGKQVKEFTLQYSFTSFGFLCAKIPRLFKYLFMCYRPGNAGNSIASKKSQAVCSDNGIYFSFILCNHFASILFFK